MSKSKRNNFIDIVKGVAIFLMLWGHCIQYCVVGSDIDFFENIVFKTIYSFHMPLFMLVSGYLFYFSFIKRDLKELLVHRIQSLLQPIVFGTIFDFFATKVLLGLLSGKFNSPFDGEWMQKLSYLLWFLWSVLAASIAVAIVCKKCKNIFLQLICLLAFVPIVALFPNIDENIYMYPYFIIGFYFAQYKDKLPSLVYKFKYLSIALFPIMLCFYEKKHYIYTTGIFPNEEYSWKEMLTIDAYRWAIGLVGAIFTLTVLELIYTYISTKLRKPIISKNLTKLGKKSIQVYVFSVTFLSTYLATFFPIGLRVLGIDNVLVKNMFIYNFVFTFLLAVLYSIILYLAIKLFERFKITRIMFGK